MTAQNGSGWEQVGISLGSFGPVRPSGDYDDEWQDLMEYTGEWWDPREPTKRFVGTLRFDNRNRPRLFLTVPFEKPELYPPLRSYPLIHGLTADDNIVTLVDCWDRNTRGKLFNTPRAVEVFVSRVIAGFHSPDRDPLLNSVSMVVKNLREWWGQPSIESDTSVKAPDAAARYTAPKAFVVYSDGGLEIAIRSVLSGSVGGHRAELTESIQIEIKACQPTRLTEFRGMLSACTDLLTVACLDLCETEQLFLEPAGVEPHHRNRSVTYHAVPVHEADPDRSPSIAHMLFRSHAVRERLPHIFQRWLAESKRLRDSRALYISGVYGGDFVEGRLLALTQAVEAFHRRFHHGLYIDQAEFDTSVLAPLKAAIPKGTDDSLRSALTARLKWGNEFSQRRRFRDLFRKYEAALQVLTDDPVEFVDRIVDHRNEFTHFPANLEDSEKVPTDAEEVLKYNLLLRLLTECCFLTVMGFTDVEITKIAKKSQTYRQYSDRFFRVPSTTAVTDGDEELIADGGETPDSENQLLH